MSKKDIESDICDLDPTKICDNCCKCIDKDADYRAVTVKFDEDSMRVFEANEEYTDVFNEPVAPLDIDPELLEKWERILSEAEAAEKAENPIPGQNLHGYRRKKR